MSLGVLDGDGLIVLMLISSVGSSCLVSAVCLDFNYRYRLLSVRATITTETYQHMRSYFGWFDCC